MISSGVSGTEAISALSCYAIHDTVPPRRRLPASASGFDLACSSAETWKCHSRRWPRSSDSTSSTMSTKQHPFAWVVPEAVISTPAAAAVVVTRPAAVELPRKDHPSPCSCNNHFRRCSLSPCSGMRQSHFELLLCSVIMFCHVP